MKLHATLAAALLAALALPARAAAQNTCTPAAVMVAAGVPITAPDGHTQVMLVAPGQSEAVSGFTRAATGGAWTPGAQDLADLAAAEATLPTTSLNLRWSGSPSAATCEQSFAMPGAVQPASPAVAPPPPSQPAIAAGTGVESRTFREGECARAGAEWAQELRRTRGSSQFTEIVFLENHNVCYRNRDFGVTGDPIHVGVFTKNSAAWDTATVQFDPCSIEPASPTVLVSDKTSALSGFQSGTTAWKLKSYPERTCFNNSVQVTAQTGIGSATVTARTTLDQATRYRATLNLGTLFTTLHDPTFGLRPDGASQRIYAQGPDNSGPEYYAAVVLYALPRYLGTLTGQHYAGRDVVHDNSLVDRLGGIIGVGLKDPRKQFITGFALETLPGVSVTGTWYFSRVTRLAGVSEGDVFTGAASAIPTRQAWAHDFAWGVALDLRYVAALASR